MKRTRIAMFFAAASLLACGHAVAATNDAPTDAVEPAAFEATVDPTPAVDLDVAQADDTAAGWQAIVSTYVTDDGGFRYEALMANADHMAALDAFVAHVGGADVSGMSDHEKLAFYINGYNALVVKAMTELWPVSGVLEEDGFFDGRTHTVAGETLTLNDLENNRIRTMGEPRIHFLVNCASAGCPPLVGQLVTADNLEQLLEAQATAYIRDTTRVDGTSIQLSQIFDWFAGDFEGAGGVRAFVSSRLDDERAAVVADEANALGFFDYDWSTNAR